MVDTKDKEDWLRPGSPEAQKKGCSCPVLDNCHGAGIGSNGERFGWWLNANCPLHGKATLLVDKPPKTGVTPYTI